MKKSKENIIQAAIILLEKDKNCSLEEIAVKAGVSRRTLHRYFKGRRELIINVFKTLGKRYLEGVLEIIGAKKKTKETIKSLLSYDLKMFSSHQVIYHLYENFYSEYKFEEETMEKVETEYLLLFSKFREEENFNELLDYQWTGAYYDSLLELGNKQIQSGIDSKLVEKTIWQLFWNGINK